MDPVTSTSDAQSLAQMVRVRVLDRSARHNYDLRCLVGHANLLDALKIQLCNEDGSENSQNSLCRRRLFCSSAYMQGCRKHGRMTSGAMSPMKEGFVMLRL